MRDGRRAGAAVSTTTTTNNNNNYTNYTVSIDSTNTPAVDADSRRLGLDRMMDDFEPKPGLVEQALEPLGS